MMASCLAHRGLSHHHITNVGRLDSEIPVFWLILLSQQRDHSAASVRRCRPAPYHLCHLPWTEVVLYSLKLCHS